AAAAALSSLADTWVTIRKSFGLKKDDDIHPDEAYFPPYQQVARAYINAIAASELPQTGRSRLAAADQAAQVMPIDVVERMLGQVRKQLIQATDHPNAGDRDLGLQQMKETERSAREFIRQAYSVLSVDPTRIGEILAQAQAMVEDLQVRVTLQVNVEECNQLISELRAHKGGLLSDVLGSNSRYQNLINELDLWLQQWDWVYQDWKAAQDESKDWPFREDDLERARTNLKSLQSDPHWVDIYNRVREAIKEEEALQFWVRIGVMIGIAIVTMGAGTAAVGFAEGMEMGAFATWGLSTGAEALTATTMNQIILTKDPSLAGAWAEFKESFVSFGVMKLVSGGYKVLANGKLGPAAAATIEHVGIQLEQTAVKVYEANEAAKRATGHGLSASEIGDLVLEDLIVSAATFIVGVGGKKQFEDLHKLAHGWGERFRGVDAHEQHAIKAARIALQLAEAHKPGPGSEKLQEALRAQREVMEKRHALLLELQENGKAGAIDVGLGDRIDGLVDDSQARLDANAADLDTLNLEPVGRGQFMHPPGKAFDEFAKRRGAEALEPDKYTGARRVKVHTPDGGSFVVTEKLAGMGEVIGGLHEEPARPAARAPSPASETPVYSVKLVELGGAAQRRVGHVVESWDQGMKVLRALADGSPEALASIGIDRFSDGFDPRTIEWGLGRRADGKFVVVRGHEAYVDWTDYPDLVPVSHSHPLRSLVGHGPDGAISLKHIIADYGNGMGRGAGRHNLIKLFPSAADVALMGRSKIDGHVVHTPYVARMVNGELVIANPVAGETGSSAVVFTIGQPEIVGYEGMTPVYRSTLKILVGEHVQEIPVWAVDSPTTGSRLEMKDPGPLSQVPHDPLAGPPGAPDAAGATPAAATAAGRVAFKPRTVAERAAVADWEALNKRSWGKSWKLDFEGEFLPMYREGWRFDQDTASFRRGGDRAHRLAPQLDADKAMKMLTRSEGFKDLVNLLDKVHPGTRADMLAALRAMDPGFRLADALRAHLRELFSGRLIDHVMALSRAELAEHLHVGPVGPGEDGLAAARYRYFNMLAGRLKPADVPALRADWYRRQYGIEAEQSVGRADNKALNLRGDRDVAISGGTVVEVIGGERQLGESELSRARDLLQMVDRKVSAGDDTVHVDKLKYVFTSELGARKNAVFIERLLNDEGAGGSRRKELHGLIEIEVIDRNGVRHVIDTLEGFVDLKLVSEEWKRPGWQDTEAHVTRVMGDDFDAQASMAGRKPAVHGAGTTRPDSYHREHNISVDAKNYDLEKPERRAALVKNVVEQVQDRDPKLPLGATHWVVIDIRGQRVDPAALHRIKILIEQKTGGLIHQDNIQFFEG
ncbi:MAG TPA: hypothetical protein VL172_05895, partial [Kofleriaceae bacterium]|nr:hypothetical protein [Kofleriaceae bacterium]